MIILAIDLINYIIYELHCIDICELQVLLSNNGTRRRVEKKWWKEVNKYEDINWMSSIISSDKNSEMIGCTSAKMTERR